MVSMSLETPGASAAERYRRELHRHCYRMLGSVTDAEDVLQETLVAAWRSGVADRAWLYKVATNRCLNAIRDAKRRPPPPFEAPEPTAWHDVTWLEPDPSETIRL